MLPEYLGISCFDNDVSDRQTNNATLLKTTMRVGTFSCKKCKIKFQLIGLSTTDNPDYCPYCGNGGIDTINVIYG